MANRYEKFLRANPGKRVAGTRMLASELRVGDRYKHLSILYERENDQWEVVAVEKRPGVGPANQAVPWIKDLTKRRRSSQPDGLYYTPLNEEVELLP